MWTSFVGFMGSGKSTLTRLLHDSTGRPVVSLDDEVERRVGLSIPEIFQNQGEPRFREHEREALEGLDPVRNLVVDTGGGIVQTTEACDLLRQRGVVLWLDVSWDVLRRRLKEEDPGQRPLVGRLGWSGLEELFRQRRRLYAAVADFRLRGDDKNPRDLASTAMLRSLLWERRNESRGSFRNSGGRR
jgi:shikimate kinase